jgi:hypothetical protein
MQKAKLSDSARLSDLVHDLGENILAEVVKFYCVNYMKLVLWLQNVIVCISTVGQQNTKKSTLAGHETNEAKLMF